MQYGGTVRLECDCGQTLAASEGHVECEDCGVSYAVTVSKLTDEAL